jgi:hypothetical protein
VIIDAYSGLIIAAKNGPAVGAVMCFLSGTSHIIANTAFFFLANVCGAQGKSGSPRTYAYEEGKPVRNVGRLYVYRLFYVTIMTLCASLMGASHRTQAGEAPSDANPKIMMHMSGHM